MARSIVVSLPHSRPALALPADAAITQTFGILARKEAGKTYLAQNIAGKMLDLGAQILAVDPVTKWWALRLDRRGRPLRRPRGKDVYILGGKKGDFPLAADKGRLVARLVVEKRISVVLDTTFLRKYQRHKFLAEFGEEFLHLKQVEDDPFPVHVFLEEAQTVLPQQRRHGDKDIDRMLGAWEDIARLGRNAGIGITMISQRPQSVNKEALSQVECLFALGVNEVPGRKVIETWVQEKGADRELVGELPGLATGEAIVWSPSWLRFFGRVRLGEKDTYDASASARLGRRRRRVGTLGKVDVRALTEGMEEVVDELGKDDPRMLQKRILELEHELAVSKVAQLRLYEEKRKAPPPKPAEPKKISVLKADDLQSLNIWTGRAEKAAAYIERAVEKLNAKLALVTKPAPALVGVTLEDGTKLPLRVQPQPPLGRQLKNPIPIRRDQTIVGIIATPRAAAKEVSVDGAPTAPQLRLVTALAQSPTGATKEKLSVLLGHKRSYRDLLLRQTKAMGLVDRVGDRFVATKAGVAALGTDFEPLPTGSALRQHWLKELPGGEKAIFAVAIQAYPERVEIDALDEATGFKRSYRDLCIRQLRAREIIEKNGRTIRASEELFQ